MDRTTSQAQHVATSGIPLPQSGYWQRHGFRSPKDFPVPVGRYCLDLSARAGLATLQISVSESRSYFLLLHSCSYQPTSKIHLFHLQMDAMTSTYCTTMACLALHMSKSSAPTQASLIPFTCLTPYHVSPHLFLTTLTLTPCMTMVETQPPGFTGSSYSLLSTSTAIHPRLVLKGHMHIEG
jgi:hypothetical protein